MKLLLLRLFLASGLANASIKDDVAGRAYVCPKTDLVITFSSSGTKFTLEYNGRISAGYVKFVGSRAYVTDGQTSTSVIFETDGNSIKVDNIACHEQ